jgi:hypothetical protein
MREQNKSRLTLTFCPIVIHLFLSRDQMRAFVRDFGAESTSIVFNNLLQLR